MAKKCIPGVFCIENMTLFILFFILLVLILLFFYYSRNSIHKSSASYYSSNYPIEPVVYNGIPSQTLGINLASSYPPLVGVGKHDVFSDPYEPPLQDNLLISGDNSYFERNLYDARVGIALNNRNFNGLNTSVGMYPSSVRGVPVNIPTQPVGNIDFMQVGILNRAGNKDGEMILPLFGRNLSTNRDKWQYYTISNSGNINTKLPVLVKGRDGLTEYGVDELYNGDVVYVQGYNDIFLATMYGNRSLSYLPTYIPL